LFRVFNCEYKQTVENKLEAAKIFREIRDDDDSDIYGQMYAHKMRISSLCNAGLFTDDFEKKEDYYLQAVDEITSFISIYCVILKISDDGIHYVYFRSELFYRLAIVLIQDLLLNFLGHQ